MAGSSRFPSPESVASEHATREFVLALWAYVVDDDLLGANVHLREALWFDYEVRLRVRQPEGRPS